MSTTNTAPLCEAPDSAPRPPSKPLPQGSCDAHAHLFGPEERYPYQPERNYTPPDASRESYVHLLRTLGFQCAVLVQPSVYGTDNSRMVDALAEAQEDPAGIEWRGVAVLGDDVSEAELERLHQLGVRGVRMNLVFRGGIDVATARRVADRIAPLGWHMQFLVDISRFDDFAGFASSLPVQSVVDHMGHMPAELGPRHRAFRDLLALLREGRTWVKLSGPNRITSGKLPPFYDVDRLAVALIETAPERLVFGTDWPHVQLPTPMPNDGDLVDEFLRWVDNDDAVTEQILVHNPAELYGF
ncbi:MAG: amidohydrolase family protein [Xanthomonadaceae bacterium]|nr:amidohydrolase family protein [Xanthomonadaceae bacterium]